MTDLRLVIFDVDGTLVDSQAEIMAAMGVAYAAVGLSAPPRHRVLGIVGLSLAEAFGQLSPEADIAQLVAGYKSAFNAQRGPDGKGEASPLYPGAHNALTELHRQTATIMAIATGKSRRGLDRMIEKHDLHGMFVSLNTADHHPSKPHPSMILAALGDAGVPPERAVMVGDTTYDMDMARAAGVRTIGVSWGYHAPLALGADRLIDTFAALPSAIDALLGSSA
jgi:phosphoglycolate phosphatase